HLRYRDREGRQGDARCAIADADGDVRVRSHVCLSRSARQFSRRTVERGPTGRVLYTEGQRSAARIRGRRGKAIRVTGDNGSKVCPGYGWALGCGGCGRL